MIIGDLRRRLLTQQNKIISPLYLFNDEYGSECRCKNITGGWQRVGANNKANAFNSGVLATGFTIQNNRLVSNNSGAYIYSYSTTNAFPLKGYSKLCFEYEWKDNNSNTTAGNGKVYFSLATDVKSVSSTTYTDALVSRLKTTTISSFTNGKRIAQMNLLTVSQEQLNIPRKLMITHNSTSGWSRFLTVYKVWLEK